MCRENLEGSGEEETCLVGTRVSCMEEVGVVFPNFRVLGELLNEDLEEIVGFLEDSLVRRNIGLDESAYAILVGFNVDAG